MKHLGDFDAGGVLYSKFTTYRPSTGAPFTLAGTPAVSIYKDGSLTQSTAGITLTVDFDGLTGLHHLAIDTSADGTFYSAGSHFEAVITTGTVDSVSVVGSCVASFSLRKDSALKATVAGRTLDVSATGEAGLDWANIGSPTTAVNLSATNIDVDQVVASVSGAVGSVTGAVGSVTGNVGGNVTGSVGSVATGGITAGSIAADAIGASELAADAVTEIATGVWAAATRTLSAGDNIVLAKGVGVTGFNDLDAAGVRGAVGLAAANLDTQIGTLATAANLATVAGYLDTEIAAILADTNELQTDWTNGGRLDLILDSLQADTDNIQTRLPAALVSGRMDASVGAMAADTVTASALAADAVTEIQTGLSTLDAAGVRTAVGLASANLDTQLAAIDDAVDTEVAAIKATTDKLDATLENTSDGWIFTTAALQQAPTAPSAADIADAVWDEPIASHAAVSGSTAEALNAAGASGDPWVAALPGSYTAGQAGFILGTNLDATVSSRASAANLATVAGYVDTEVAAIKAVTDKLDGTLELTSDGQIFTAAALQNAPTSSGGLDAAGVRAAIGLASANLDTQLADLPTNAELSTALAASDDAVLAVLGTPAGASISADVAAVQSDTNDIQGRLPAALISGRIDATVGAMQANVMTAAAAAADLTTELQSGLATSSALATLDGKVDVIDGVVDAILVDTAEIGVAGAGLTVLATAANLATVAGYLDTEIAAILADTNELQTDWTNGGRLDLLVDAIKAKTDALPASPAAVSDVPTAAAIADAVHDEVVEGTVTLRQSIRLHNSALGGKVQGLDTFNPVFRDLADSKDVIDATVDSYGNRSAVTRDLT
jgi:cell division protein ZapA (FtsZ GTPase activity inhibitor)